MGGSEADFDDGMTKTYVIPLNPTNSSATNIIIQAVPYPDIAESNLPPCWTLVGGTGTNKLSRQVDVSHVGTNVILSQAGPSLQTNIIIVASTADSDYDGRNDYQEFLEGTSPHNAADKAQVFLASWSFDTQGNGLSGGTNAQPWLGDQGQVPLVATNIQAMPGMIGTAALINSTNSTRLAYRDVEQSGSANFNCANGTLRFWFSPQ